VDGCPCEHHESVWGVEVQLHSFLTSTQIEVSCHLQAPAVLLPVSSSLLSTEYDAGWAPEPVWALGQKMKMLHLQQIEPRFIGCLARSLVTVQNTLSQIAPLLVYILQDILIFTK